MVRILNAALIVSQLGLSASALAQVVVQQPVVSNFSYSGSASIPDAGTGYLGGLSSSRSGSVSRGFLPSSSVGGASAGGSIANASVQVIDLEALDQAILNSKSPASARASTSNSIVPSDRDTADKARQFLSTYSSTPPSYRAADYTDLKRTLGSIPRSIASSDSSLAESNVRYYLQLGREAEQAHRIQASRVYFRMALDSMTPELMERYQMAIAQRKGSAQAKAKADADGRVKF
jgi:hypothetical protein